MAILIHNDLCTRCGRCAEICPEDVLQYQDHRIVVGYPDECWYCGSCTYECPHDAIEVEFSLALGPHPIEF